MQETDRAPAVNSKKAATLGLCRRLNKYNKDSKLKK